MGTISTMEKSPGTVGQTIATGAAMDRVIEKKRFPARWVAGAVAGTALLLLAWYMAVSNSGRSLAVADNRIILSQVVSGIFEDTIPVRARVAPLKTVFLDAVQGGRVEEVLAEDGASVEAGQVIVRLSNSDLQLSVMSTESRVMEQLNSMRDQELRLEQNRLAHKRTLVEADYQIRRLGREIARQDQLMARGLAAHGNYEDLVDELEYNKALREVTRESQASDERLMVAQLAFFREKNAVMEENLRFARQSLEELQVKAPVSGKLSGFDMEIGQNVTRGTRIGQIDNANEFKLVANIDEFYLGRTDIDQVVTFTRGGREHALRVSKIYPNVEGGQFEIDMQFVSGAPRDLRRGQTLQAKLTLGDASEALLIPNGSFFQDTGGQWIFVASPDGGTAVRREIKLGRRNTRYIEVLDGLEEGEVVITSPYSGFRDMDTLILNNSDRS
jgi:HlyD family secretion protein